MELFGDTKEAWLPTFLERPQGIPSHDTFNGLFAALDPQRFLELDAEKFARAARSHWGVENPLHWVLDVVFGEDQSRARTGRAAENLATLRRRALNFLKADTRKAKCSIKGRIKAAGWDHDYLLHLLALNPNLDA
jgi:hypothetical protein